MDIPLEHINTCFNQTLEALATDNTSTFSIAFAQHHQAQLEQELAAMQKKIGRNFIIVTLLILLVFANQYWQIINIPYFNNQNSYFMVWLLFAVTTHFNKNSTKRMAAIENQIMLIGVYKKIVGE